MSYILGAPDFVNAAASASCTRTASPPPHHWSPGVTVLPVPDPGDAVSRSWPECLRGEVVEGFSLVVYEGGSVEDLESCARSLAVTAVYALADGEYVSYILGAQEFVNREFRELFADGLPSATALVARGEALPTAGRGQLTGSTPTPAK